MRFLTLLLVLFMSSIATAHSAKSDCELTFASPELKPHFWLEGDVAKGLAVDYFRLIEQRTQCRFSFEIKPWKRVLHEIKTGRVDATIGYYNEVRSEFAYFPNDHFQHQSLFLYSRSDSKESYSIEKLQSQNKSLLYLQYWYLGELSSVLAKKPNLSLPTPDPQV